MTSRRKQTTAVIITTTLAIIGPAASGQSSTTLQPLTNQPQWCQTLWQQTFDDGAADSDGQLQNTANAQQLGPTGKEIDSHDAIDANGRTGRGLRCIDVSGEGTHGWESGPITIPPRCFVLVSAWSLPVQLEPFSGDTRYELVATMTDATRSGKTITKRVAFDADDPIWQNRWLMLEPSQATTIVTVRAEMRHLRGEVRFDDLAVTAIRGDARGSVFPFDAWPTTQLPTTSVPKSTSPMPKVTLTTSAKDDAITPTCRFAPADTFAIKRQTPTTFLPLADAMRRVELNVVASKPTTRDTKANTADVGDDYSLSIMNPSTTSLIGTIYLTWPIDAIGGVWADDGFTSRPIAAGAKEFHSLIDLGIGRIGSVSKYPLAAITTRDGETFAIAMPLSPVRFVRFSYNSTLKSLVVAWDIALRANQSATLELHAWRFRDAEPFRAAWQHYMTWQSDTFVVRAKTPGLWMPFASISSIRTPDDFGFAFKEGLEDIDYCESHRIATFAYIEPNAWWLKTNERPIFSDTIKTLVNEFIHTGAAKDKPSALAVLTSSATGLADRPRYDVRHAPWASGAVFAMNPDPAVSEKPNRASVALGENLAMGDDRIDGLFVDNLDGWSLVRNFNRRHLAAYDDVAAFDPFSGKMCLLNLQSIAKFIEYTGNALHAKNKLLMCNYHPTLTGFAMPFLDVPGQETYWKWNGEFMPMPFDELFFRRALSGNKPYGLLQNTDFTQFTAADVKRYLARCLAFGIWPGMFSADAMNSAYFTTPSLVERDRETFRTTIIHLRRLAEAGWQPTRRATLSSPALICERFGEFPNAMWTVYNPTDDAIAFTLTPPSGHAIAGRVAAQQCVIVEAQP